MNQVEGVPIGISSFLILPNIVADLSINVVVLSIIVADLTIIDVVLTFADRKTVLWFIQNVELDNEIAEKRERLDAENGNAIKSRVNPKS